MKWTQNHSKDKDSRGKITVYIVHMYLFKKTEKFNGILFAIKMNIHIWFVIMKYFLRKVIDGECIDSMQCNAMPMRCNVVQCNYIQSGDGVQHLGRQVSSTRLKNINNQLLQHINCIAINGWCLFVNTLCCHYFMYICNTQTKAPAYNHELLQLI